MTPINVENLDCPQCRLPHHDINEWGLKPHQTHLCLHCGMLFEGRGKAVSHPTFTPNFVLPENDQPVLVWRKK